MVSSADKKSLFHNAVGFVEQVQDGQLHPVGAIVIGHGNGAQNNIQLLASDALSQGLLHLVARQVNEQVETRTARDRCPFHPW